MTNEEAICRIEEARQYIVRHTPEEQEAHEVAFAALRAQGARKAKMPIDEVIRNLEEARKLPVAYTPEEQEAYDMAFMALKAQQEEINNLSEKRSECESCCKWQVCGCDSYEPHYCRDCGRPQTESGWVALMDRINALKAMPEKYKKPFVHTPDGFAANYCEDYE